MWNPTRRNKNNGTSKQGHRRSNKLTIPNPYITMESFYGRLNVYEKIEKIINGHVFIFIIASTRESCKHACSLMDIDRIIENVPSMDYSSLKLIVLRQPKRKEEIISPVWERSIYSYEFEGDYPAIIIEAVDYSKKTNWNKSQSVDAQREFERLKIAEYGFIENRECKKYLTLQNTAS